MIRDALIIAFRELRRNLLRSVLTSLGIIIGVASVITMVTLGNGATEQVRRQIASLGSNLLMVHVGQAPRGHGGARAEAPPFDLSDARAIEREIYGIEAVAPMAGTAMQVIYGNRNRLTSVFGTTNGFFEVRDWEIAEGRVFLEGEERAGKTVCILGQTVVKELFPYEDPIGKIVRLKKQAYRVVGVLKEKGLSSFGTDRDDIVLIPIKAFHRRIAGNTDINRIEVSVLDESLMEQVRTDIEALMRQRRRIRPGELDDFHVRDMREIAEVLSGTTKSMTSLLAAIAAVSLLVGGIGIMNIMLVAVTERTREIGIRMAVGALPRDVLLQFLVESAVISSLGGFIGIFLALGCSVWLSKVLLVPFVLDPLIVGIAFLFSALIGIAFGFFPARRAAHLNPIDALRHE
ncbi:ABC transporter permease [Thermodesulforhabdus norvegica]|uniref:Putative ABC transport system permease protein n=1 Tax=Thermodesulforhabdus norvegica TaxID=39841 RepID=A0A1I4S462_9BACT|nr:ABC transporter permease [Thermodesulforhabdus norvegica]SFM59298.1 putative ABC transport system permease protein [Thermodesulforhabdus norvegica]